MLKIILVLLFAAVSPFCFSQIYVSTTGSDGFSGATPALAKKTIKAAVTASLTGGEILILNGSYTETDIVIQKALTIRKANATDVVSINGNNPASTTQTIFYIKTGKVTIKDLIIKDLIFNNANGIFIENGDSITIRNCNISNIGWKAYDPVTPAASNTISASAIKARSGLASAPITRVYIVNNTIFNCAVGYGEGITIDGNVNGFIIDSNTVYNITNPGIDAHGGSNISGQGIYRARNGKIRNNIVYNCLGTHDIAAGIYLDGALNCLVERNIVHHNQVGISLGAEVATSDVSGGDTIRNNVIYNNSIFGMIIGSLAANPPNKIQNIDILHNTFFRNRTMDFINGVTLGIDATGPSGGEISFQSVDNITLQGNNIHRRDDRLIWYIQGSAQKVTNCIFKNNNYFRDQNTSSAGTISITFGSYFNSGTSNGGSYSTLADFQSAFPTQEIATLSQYSMFTDTSSRNFKPLPGSPIINMGNPALSSLLSGTNDIAGLQRIICNRIDIGAHELNIATPTPTITPNGMLSTCEGTPVLLTSSASSGNQWFLNSTALTGSTSNTYSAAISGSYTVTTTQNGCTSLQSIPATLTINPIPASPVIVPSGNQSICQGQSVVLTSSASSGNQWYRDGIQISGATTAAYSATISGTYSVRITQNICSSLFSNNVSVTVNPIPPTPSISPNGSVATCPGVPLQFLSSAPSGNQWFLNTTSLTNQTNQTYSTAQAGNYTVKATIAGCSSAASAPTVVSLSNTPSAPVATATGSTVFCEGDSVKLFSSILNNNQWFINGIMISNATSPFYIARTVGLYTVKQGTSGCTSAASNSISVTVLQNPPPPIITSAGTILKTTTGYNSYQWFLNGSILPSASSDTYNAATVYGLYTVKVFNSNGCGATSLPYLYDQANLKDSIFIFGNPVMNSKLIVVIKGYAGKKIKGQIYNLLGQKVSREINLTSGINTIPISNILSNGMYLIQIIPEENYKDPETKRFEILR